MDPLSTLLDKLAAAVRDDAGATLTAEETRIVLAEIQPAPISGTITCPLCGGAFLPQPTLRT